MRLAFSVFFVLVGAACASPDARSPSQLLPSDVIEVGAAPPGYSLADKLTESCSGRRGFRAIEDEPLSDVDCSVDRLSRTLRARAAEQRSPYLVEKSCRARGRDRVRIDCAARLVTATSRVPLSESVRGDVGPAPSPGRVLDLDEPRPQDSRSIRVSFAPTAPGARASRLPPRAYDGVAETAEPSVGRTPLGQLSARCPDCERPALHHALRVLAGRVGAGEVSDVRCFDEAGSTRCVATALEPWRY
jgi:hypothetical protein